MSVDRGVETDTGVRNENGPGARLRDVRERRGLSVDAVARSLRLDTRVINALEADDYNSLPAPIFVKGYLNAYCRMLGLSPREVLAAYERGMAKAPPPSLTVSTGTGRQVTSSHARIVFTSWGIGLLALAMVVLWWTSRPHDPPGIALEPEATVVPAEVPAEVTAPTVANDTPQVARLDLDTQEVMEPVDTATTARPEGWLQVEVTFTEDCWTEITDVDGRRLYFALARAGRTIEVEGQGPFQVFLGNSPAARFVVNGRAFDHTRYTREGDIARFSIETEQDP